MKFVIKYFPEITIKSKPVRLRLSQRLGENLRTLLKVIDKSIRVEARWDKLTVDTADLSEEQLARVREVLRNTPGIANFLDVVEFPLGNFDDMATNTVALWGERLTGKRFVVRCKRSGKHEFRSNDVERFVGGALLQQGNTAGVDLHTPDVTVRLEIYQDRLLIVNSRYEGLGGFPIGGPEPVLSLVSGGFDSTVASYLTMRRGIQTHFLFFNLGGHAHEVGVKEISLYLWMKYGASHRVKFVTVPFDGVVGEILKQVDNAYMGVVLKRMMLRAATKVAQDMDIQALVTGEAVAQVSSQTLTNLAVIDESTDMLVLRPLIASDKTDIIRISREIGAEDFAANIPEYCGVISVKPKTAAKLDKVVQQEEKFDFSVLEQSIIDRRIVNIDEIDLDAESAPDLEVLGSPLAESIVIDVRHPSEVERSPLQLGTNEVVEIPFYELHGRFEELDQQKRYMLYCDKGVMSKLHASHLVAEGYDNVCVYRPA